MTEPERLLTITELSIARTNDARLELDRVSLAVDEHETVVILGEDRSGKDALMRALCGALEDEERTTGSFLFGAPDERPRIGSAAVRVVYLPGPSSKPLSPHASAISQLARVIARKLGAPHGSGRAEFEQEIAKLDGAPALISFEKRAGELSPEILAWGLLAAALAQTPDLLLIDHLFEGIAPQAARPLERALLAAKARLNCALVCATMMTETAVRLGGRLVVLRGGRIVEEGPVVRLATAQAHAYTQTLFKDVVPRERNPQRGQPVLQALHVGLRPDHGTRDEINFELRRGASLALVGEDGSGRRDLVRRILGMERLDKGRIVFDAVDIGILSPQMMSRLRRRVAVIAGADDVLDPRMSLSETVAEPLRAHLHLPGDLVANYRENALRRVGLASLPGHLPISALSNFDRRRLQVARAIVTAPVLAIVDEPFRGLDAFAQSVIRDLLQSFRVEEGPAFLVITSDFAVARALADDAMVFRDGRVVDRGVLADMLRSPKNAYTRTLVEASRLDAQPSETLPSAAAGS
jgi:peptide/nickel transport system ATP-binding protein